MRYRNHQDIGITKRRRTAHGKVVLSGDKADESDDNEAASQEVDNSTTNVICEELEKNEKVEVGDGELVNSEPENDAIEAKHINKQVDIGGGEIADIDEEPNSSNRKAKANEQVVSCAAVDGKFADSEPDNGHIVTEAGDKQVVSYKQGEITDGEDEVPENGNGEVI